MEITPNRNVMTALEITDLALKIKFDKKSMKLIFFSF